MDGILIPVIIENISSRKDKTWKIIVGTNEITPQKAGELSQMVNGMAICYISPKGPNQSEIDQVDKVNPEFGGKTQSQRLRNVLYKLFEQDQEGYKDFDSFYRDKTEKFIEFLKAKIQ
jgi:hypothetical protein